MKLGSEMEEFKLDEETRSDDENIGTWHRGRKDYRVETDSLLENKGNGDVVRNLVELGEMPELVIFLKERNYSFVKDICIDMEIPSQNKCSIENCELNHHIIDSFLDSDVDTDSKSTKEATTAVLSILNASKSSNEQDTVSPLCSTNFSMERKGDFDGSTDIEDGGSSKETVSGRLVVAGELDTNYSQLQFSNSNGDGCEQKYNKVPSKGAVLATSMVSFAPEAPHNNSSAIAAASKSEVETRTTTSDCGSSVTTISGGEGISPGISDCQPRLRIVNTPGLEDEMSERLIVSSQIRDHGESSLSSVGPLSVPMTYSGTTLSLRSNSNSSTRSFTFPVLPSEWNGSPLRMVEPHRKHLRKNKSWREFFLCCKF